MAAGGLQIVGGDGSVLDKFCEDRESEWRGFGGVAEIREKNGYQVMHLAPPPRAMADKQREQFVFLDKTVAKAN